MCRSPNMTPAQSSTNIKVLKNQLLTFFRTGVQLQTDTCDSSKIHDCVRWSKTKESNWKGGPFLHHGTLCGLQTAWRYKLTTVGRLNIALWRLPLLSGGFHQSSVLRPKLWDHFKLFVSRRLSLRESDPATTPSCFTHTEKEKVLSYTLPEYPLASWETRQLQTSS